MARISENPELKLIVVFSAREIMTAKAALAVSTGLIENGVPALPCMSLM